MELIKVIKARHSVRQYQEKDVSDEQIRKIIELAKTAPSAGGLKSYEIFVTKEKVTGQVDAPIYLVVCAWPEKSGKRYGDRGRDLYSIQDATIFAAYVQLIAVDMGLSSVWIGAFREGKISRMLKIEPHLRPIVIIALGYAL